MKVYEIHLNPSEPKKTLRTSYFEPQDIYQSKAGSLFISGQLDGTGTDETQLLSGLSGVIQESYYSSQKEKQEHRLKESLKKANEFLKRVVDKGEIKWMASFSFCILSLKSNAKRELKVALTTMKGIEVILLRQGQIVNLGEKAKSEIDPYPLTVFSKMISGSVSEDDRVLILNNNVYAALLEKNLINSLATAPSIDKKSLSKTLSRLRDETEGFIMVMDLSSGDSSQKMTISKRTTHKRFIPLENLKKSDITKKISEIKSSLPSTDQLLPFEVKIEVPEIKTPSVKLPKKISIPKISIPKQSFTLFPLLVLLTALGLWVSNIEQNKNKEEILNEIALIQEKELKADSYTLEGRESEASALYLKAWQDIKKLSPKGALLAQDEIEELSTRIEKALLEVNKLQVIDNLSPFYTTEDRSFIPDKIRFYNNRIYLLSLSSERVHVLPTNGGDPFDLHLPEKPYDTTSLDEGVLTLLKDSPPQMITKEVGEALIIDPDNSQKMIAFDSNLYSWDKESGQILKRAQSGDAVWGSAQSWLHSPIPEDKRGDVRSIAIDGGLWILFNKHIERYYKGGYEKEIQINLFPEIQEFNKIVAPYKSNILYVLDSLTQRVVMIQKETGSIQSQLQVTQLSNLKDMIVNEDDRVIYLLNGHEIYLLEL